MRNGINNKALFITALGVYFGLMLSGAVPNALARQAAVSRSFDIRDEIEFSDDFDRDPDPGKAIEGFASALVEIYRITSEFSAEHPGEFEDRLFDFNGFVTIFERGGGNLVLPGEYYSGGRRFLLPAFRPLSSLFDTLLRTNPIADSPSNAERIAWLFDGALLSRKEKEINVLRSLIYSSIIIGIDNTNVVIAAHLPRSSIDPLPAANEM